MLTNEEIIQVTLDDNEDTERGPQLCETFEAFVTKESSTGPISRKIIVFKHRNVLPVIDLPAKISNKVATSEANDVQNDQSHIEIFCKNVASEMKLIRNPTKIRTLKRKIQELIYCDDEEHEENGEKLKEDKRKREEKVRVKEEEEEKKIEEREKERNKLLPLSGDNEKSEEFRHIQATGMAKYLPLEEDENEKELIIEEEKMGNVEIKDEKKPEYREEKKQREKMETEKKQVIYEENPKQKAQKELEESDDDAMEQEAISILKKYFGES